MSTISEWLDGQDALAGAATEGPWEATTAEATMNDRSEWRIGDRSRPQVARSIMTAADAEFIASSRDAHPKALAALRAVLDLHQPRWSSVTWLVSRPDDAVCAGCGRAWPCATVDAVAGSLGVNP